VKDKEEETALKASDDEVWSEHVSYLFAVAQRTCGHSTACRNKMKCNM
jgi:hypothetical protein